MRLARISKVLRHVGVPTQCGLCAPHRIRGGIRNARLLVVSVILACHLAVLRQQAVIPCARIPGQSLNAKMLIGLGVCVQARILGGSSSAKHSVKAFLAGEAFRLVLGKVLASLRLCKDASPVITGSTS